MTKLDSFNLIKSMKKRFDKTESLPTLINNFGSSEFDAIDPRYSSLDLRNTNLESKVENLEMNLNLIAEHKLNHIMTSLSDLESEIKGLKCRLRVKDVLIEMLWENQNFTNVKYNLSNKPHKDDTLKAQSLEHEYSYNANVNTDMSTIKPNQNIESKGALDVYMSYQTINNFTEEIPDFYGLQREDTMINTAIDCFEFRNKLRRYKESGRLNDEQMLTLLRKNLKGEAETAFDLRKPSNFEEAMEFLRGRYLNERLATKLVEEFYKIQRNENEHPRCFNVRVVRAMNIINEISPARIVYSEVERVILSQWEDELLTHPYIIEEHRKKNVLGLIDAIEDLHARRPSLAKPVHKEDQRTNSNAFEVDYDNNDGDNDDNGNNTYENNVPDEYSTYEEDIISDDMSQCDHENPSQNDSSYSSYLDNLKYQQSLDPEAGEIIRNLLNNNKSQLFNKYVIINDILYIYKDCWKLFVPQDYVVQTMDHMNSLLNNNNVNLIHEIKEMSSNFYWKGMLKDLKAYYRCNKIRI